MIKSLIAWGAIALGIYVLCLVLFDLPAGVAIVIMNMVYFGGTIFEFKRRDMLI